MGDRMPDSDEVETEFAGGEFVRSQEDPDVRRFDSRDAGDEDDVDYEDENIISGID